jgi:hypothetical protein
MRQIGISPKLIADLLTSVIAFLVVAEALGLDPVLSAAIAKALGTVAAFATSPGVVQLYERPADDPDGELGEIGVLELVAIVLVVLLIVFLVERL